MTTQAQLVYFSHGGGPLPLLGDEGHAAMIRFMRALPATFNTPEAILVISAHWEERVPTLQAAPNPAMFYDYYGFPPEAYQVNYPAPGDPVLASEIAGQLKSAGIPSALDTQRGFDHGLFIPLLMMYPDANIPSLQLSLIQGLDAGAHLALGRALRPLLARKLLIIGSGFSFHNLRGFFGGKGEDKQNDAFQDWLIETITSPMNSEVDRHERLLRWEQAPFAHYCHPREEHLLPLHVCQAMAGEAGRLIFDDEILGKRATAFLWTPA